jgi:enamine deaminase RidA (YjgF/YER057c/UK114 family)
MRSLLALLAAATSVPALAGARQEAAVVMPENPQARQFLEEWGFSDAIIAGDTVYLSGVVVGLRPGETDLAAAYTRAFDHIGATLNRAGVSWDDVVDITSYHTDLTTQMPAIVAVKNRHVKAPFPAWTAIGVSRLIPDRGLTEIKLVAKLPKKR